MMLAFLLTCVIFRLHTKIIAHTLNAHTMHILFTDSHPRRIAEATRTDQLQSALDDIILTLQTAARLFDSHARIAIAYDQKPTEQHDALADWVCLSQSNWRHLSNIASMLLFEISFRSDRRRQKKKKATLITGDDRDFDTYKKAVNWCATDVPINLPENGFFDVPFLSDPFYSWTGMSPLDAYRLAYADKELTDDDLDDRDVPEWFAMSLQQLINYRKRLIKEIIGEL